MDPTKSGATPKASSDDEQSKREAAATGDSAATKRTTERAERAATRASSKLQPPSTKAGAGAPKAATSIGHASRGQTTVTQPSAAESPELAAGVGDHGNAPTPASDESANDDARHGDAGKVMQETGIAHASVTGAASAGTATTLAQPAALSELTPVAFEHMLRRIVQDMLEPMQQDMTRMVSTNQLPTLVKPLIQDSLNPVKLEMVTMDNFTATVEPIRKQAQQTVEKQAEMLEAEDRIRSDHDTLSRRYTKGSADFQQRLEQAAGKIQDFHKKVEDIKHELAATARWQEQMQQDMQAYQKRLENHASAKKVAAVATSLEGLTTSMKTYQSATDTRLDSAQKEVATLVEDARLRTVEYQSFTENVLHQLKEYEQQEANQALVQDLLELSEIVTDMQLTLDAQQHEWQAGISGALQLWLNAVEAGEEE